MFSVVAAQAAFTCVVGEATQFRTLVQCSDGIGGQGAERHGGDVHQRHVVGLGAVVAADAGAWRLGRFHGRHHRVDKVLEASLCDVAFGAVRHFALGTISALVDDLARLVVERPSVPVAFDEILVDFGANFVCQVARVSEDGVVAEDRVVLLVQVPGGERCGGRGGGSGGDNPRFLDDEFSYRRHRVLHVELTIFAFCTGSKES